jgi:lipoprotein LprG
MTLVPPRHRLGGGVRTAFVAVVTAAVATATLTACSESGAQDEPDAAEVLLEAKQRLDATSGVELALTTQELPQGVDGVMAATGTVTRAPAFEGTLKVRANNLTADVPVVSVGGTVFAQVPFSTKMAEINPADYGAPDPALLMDPEAGLSGWLTETREPRTGKKAREGDQVLTEYSGTLPGDVVADTIPSAVESADFPVTFSVDDDGALRTVDISGPFYGAEGEVDYVVAISAYDVAADIRRP